MSAFRIPPASALALIGLTALPLAIFALPQKPVPAQPVRYNRDVKPILSDRCFQCHGPDANTRKANLRLDTEEGIRKVFGGRDPAKALGLHRITAAEPARRMPPPGTREPLTAAHIDTIRRWVRQGAPYEAHWAFIPPVLPDVPKVVGNRQSAVDSRQSTVGVAKSKIQNPKSKIANWCRNPIDSFVLDRLLRAGLRPAPESSKETLIRRVTLDLTGLPPTPAEIDAFLADRGTDAYEKVVDRLLASPRFGERMVWEWLDVARYSDTNGYQEDRARPMWPWRDWVVDALNRNMPFDQFTIEQIAGDMLPNPSVSQRIATGFNRNVMLNGEGGRIPEESRVDYVMDRVETTSTAWLGLTMGCAKCHDHKFDPFSQKDYYQLFAYFNNVPETGAVDRNGAANPVLPLPTPEQSARIEMLRKELDAANAQVSSLPKDTPEQAEAVKKQAAAKKALTDAQNSVLEVMVMEEGPARQSHVLAGGDYEKPVAKVSAGVPALFAGLPEGAPNNRLGFARWLVSRGNPLTARVTVNRIWQTIFGEGLVKTAEDFGVQGELPSHPELLDWLAVVFMDGSRQSGSTAPSDPKPWDLKALIRLVVTSAAYRQSAAATADKLEKDPANRLLSRGPRYRLPAFTLRDQALTLSGLLVEKQGGPPVKPYQPEGVWEDFSYGKITYQQDHGEALYRRSLYTFWRRSVAPTELFDSAARRVCTVRVERTNTPLQSLTLMNSVTFVEASRKLAERMMKEGGSTPEQRIGWGFRLASGRRPSPKELSVLTASLARYAARFRSDRDGAMKLLKTGESPYDTNLDIAELAAYATVANTILNLDEVLCKE